MKYNWISNMTETSNGFASGSTQERDKIKHRTRARFQQLMNTTNIEGDVSYSSIKDVDETPLLADDYSKMYPASQSSSEDNNSGQSNPAYANETSSETSYKDISSSTMKVKKSGKDVSSSKITSPNRKKLPTESNKKSIIEGNTNTLQSSDKTDFEAESKRKGKETREKLEQEEDVGPILGIVIHGTDRLKTDFLIHHPVVKVHIVDLTTGSYVKKLHSDRSVTSYYETLNETVNYILPIMTQPYDFEAKRYLIPMWEELLMFNEDYSYFIEGDTQIIVFFEIMDFIGSQSSGNINLLKRIQEEGGWHKVAWAFLKLKGTNNVLNVEKKLRLQLYNPGKSRFWKKVEGIEVYNWWHKRSWVYYPSTLYVTVKPIMMSKSMEAATRSMAPFQEEKSFGLLLTGLEGRNDLQQNDIQSSPKKVMEQMDLWSRVAGQKCKVPNSLLFASQCSAYGCNAIKFSHSGRILVYGCSLGNGHHIIVHKIPSGTLFYQVKAHAGIIYDLDWSKNDDFLVSASGDGTVRIWSAINLEFTLTSTLPHPCFVYSAKFHPKRPSILVTGSYDKVVRVWSLENSEKGELCMELEGHHGNINALCWNSKGSKLFSADSVGIIKIWNVDFSNSQGMKKEWSLDQQIEIKEIHDIPINTLCMHSGDKKLLFNSRSSTVFLYDLTVNLAVHHFRGYVNFQHLLRCCFSPCGNLVFAGGEDGKVIVWNANTGDKLAVYNELPYLGPVTSLDYHPYDHIIAMCSLEHNAPVLVYKYDYKEQHIGLEKSGISRNTTEQVMSPIKGNKTSESSRSGSPVSDTYKEIRIDSRLANVRNLETEKEARLQQVVKKLDSVLNVVSTLKKQKNALPSLDEPDAATLSGSTFLTHWDTIKNSSSLSASHTKSPHRKKLNLKQDNDSYISNPHIGKKHEAFDGDEVVALYNYESGFPDELPLKRGDIIQVLKRDDSEWWYGCIKGTQIEGYFPYNYVTTTTSENYVDLMDKDEDEKLDARRSMTALITKSGNFEIISGSEDDTTANNSRRQETPTNVSSQKRQKRRLQRKQVEYD